MSEMEAEKRPREEAPEFSATAAASDDLPTSKKTRAEAEPAAAQSVPALGAQDLDALAKLLAFYFSDANLRRDKFLIAEQAKTVDGWVPIRVLLTFNKVKQVSITISGLSLKSEYEDSQLCFFVTNKSAPFNIEAFWLWFGYFRSSSCFLFACFGFVIRSHLRCRTSQPQPPRKRTGARTCLPCLPLGRQYGERQACWIPLQKTTPTSALCLWRASPYMCKASYRCGNIHTYILATGTLTTHVRAWMRELFLFSSFFIE
jgi:hypothetical protein